MEEIQLSDHFDAKRLARFVFPTIIMTIFTSIYNVVDGFFISNFSGVTEFAAVNFSLPVIMILCAAGFVFGTGGSALVAKYLGEGKHGEACRIFSFIVYMSIVTGLFLAIIGFIFIRPLASLMGAEGEMLDDCVLYSRIVFCCLPFYMLQIEFQSFFVTAGKPKLGMWTTIATGSANIILDAVFVGLLGMGLVGAAVATVISVMIGGLLPLFFFGRVNDTPLRLCSSPFNGKALIKTCSNGSSELMTSISMSFVGMLYNIRLLEYAGENGIAAFGVLMYVEMVFLACFIGYSLGTAPIISFKFGAKDHAELKNILLISLKVIFIASIIMFVAGELLGTPIAYIFTGYDEELLKMTSRGFMFFSFSFLFSGFSIFGSSFFTALNNGLISALISFLRTLVFQTAAVLILPIIYGLDGIWGSVVAAEVVSVIVTFSLLLLVKNRYHYL